LKNRYFSEGGKEEARLLTIAIPRLDLEIRIGRIRNGVYIKLMKTCYSVDLLAINSAADRLNS
jgi:hypothetical protein